MYPEIFHISFLHSYGFLVAVAFLVALWLVGKLARESGLNPEHATDLGLSVGIAAIVGAKLLLFVVDPPHSFGEFFSLSTLQAGGVFYGGLIAALAVAFWYMRRYGLPPLRTADAFAPAIALGHGIGRLGCFAAGCCWGTPSTLPWAVVFTDPEAQRITGVPLGVALHPTQIYEALAEFAICLILLWRFRRPHGAGSLISLYVVLYAGARFLVEFVRNHEQTNPFGGPLDTSQWISLCLAALGAYGLAATRGRRRLS